MASSTFVPTFIKENLSGKSGIHREKVMKKKLYAVVTGVASASTGPHGTVYAPRACPIPFNYAIAMRNPITGPFNMILMRIEYHDGDTIMISPSQL